MLTKDIRQTIDNARQALVGKIPNPQSQIDQITTAMIYKFMDDMDLESIELGGERQYFTEELEKFAWSKLMSPQIGNEGRLKLYAEALEKLPISSKIPKLFRDIFKGAYLPYKDSQTLSLFLKEINDISYDNSENLGNAFEYLLSIMGSQGDAGMFRTPRHIIDFIVNVVQPKKIDTILDPACGTAGFLISAYKYILREAKENNQLLTPTERIKLTENIQGYDISPDMVKLALVNMYLHSFKNPKINEYDTLTSSTRWEEYFDCILANPPFMTPKGGIQPHNKFSVKANRSEVLFVDYIMEHINSTGKAGIVVPEGIVFQSAKAYRQLRKKLVDENYLYAVVSLPSGVFQPYSGVKTSILLLDKQLAKKTDKILFVEIQNDGFDLGAQRREIDKNDLPEAIEIINRWQNIINSHSELNLESLTKSKLVTIVEKSKLAENEEYNLTASRYKEAQDYSNCKWNMVKLSDVCELKRGLTYSKNDEVANNEGVPVLRANNIDLKTNVLLLNDIKFINGDSNLPHDKKLLQDDIFICLASGSKDHIGKVAYIDKDTDFYFGGFMGAIRSNKQKIKPKYLYNCLASKNFNQYLKNTITGVNINNLNANILYSYEIPLPPLEIQEEIVKELDGYQAVIDGAQKVIDNWKPTLPINPNWEKVKLGNTDYLEIIDGDRGINYPSKNDFSQKGYCLFLNTKNVLENGFYFADCQFITKEKDEILRKGKLQRQDVVMTTRGTIGNVGVYSENIEYEHLRINSGMVIFRPTVLLDSKFLFQILRSSYIKNQIQNIISGAAQPQLPIRSIIDINILIPKTLEEQKNIVAKIEEEEKAIEECKKLIEIHKQKINAKIKLIWGDDSI